MIGFSLRHEIDQLREARRLADEAPDGYDVAWKTPIGVLCADCMECALSVDERGIPHTDCFAVLAHETDRCADCGDLVLW